MQNTKFIPDKELSLKIFIYGKHLYVVKYESYKFKKVVRFWPTLYITY